MSMDLLVPGLNVSSLRLRAMPVGDRGTNGGNWKNRAKLWGSTLALT
jgi:hypothetical protein